MSSIDERVVEMKFKNGQFQSGVKDTLSSLDNLKKGLNLDGAKASILGLAEAGRNFTLAGMGTSVEAVSGKFVALAAVGIAALSGIVNKAVASGTQIVNSLTIDPIKAGLSEYETKLGSIQTILANTSGENTTLDQVTDTLDKLNEYSDKTIYNFQEMTRNIGTFTAAGVSLDTSANAIKGIANLAALSGSNSQQASTAMYQLSQALSSGRVTLMDWNSVVNAGMGGKVFQEAIKETARTHGVAVDDMIADAGSFRNSLEKGWLTADILTDTLMKFTGDLTDAQLESMGYTKEQIVEIQKMAQTANDAATKVKTMSQLISTLQESAQSGWAKTWEIVFGDFDEAKELFTNVNDVIGAMIGQSADARNKVLEDWKMFGGRAVAIEAVQNAFNALMGILAPIREAFRDLFPATTGAQLWNITDAIRDFTAKLIIGEETAEKIKRTFRGFFAILDIGWMIIKQVASTLFGLFGNVAEGGDDFLTITANIGDFLVKVRNAIKQGDGLAAVFKVIGDVLQKPIDLLKQFLGTASENLTIEKFTAAWEGLGQVLRDIGDFFRPVGEFLIDIFHALKKVMKDTFTDFDPSILLAFISTGAITGIALMVKKFIKDIPGLFGGIGGGIVDTIKGAFGALTDTLSTMQQKLKAETLKQIAIAIAILAAAVLVLSFVEPSRLGGATAAIGAMAAELVTALIVLDKAITPTNMAKLPVLAGSLILLSTALLILSGAVAKMGELSWEEIGKGLLGMAGGLAILSGAVRLISGKSAGMITAGLGIIALSVAMRILASALKEFAGLSWDDLLKGISAVAALLTIIGIFSKVTAKIGNIAASAVGIIIIAGAMLILAVAIERFAGMSMEQIGSGLVAIGGALVIIALAMQIMPKNMLLTAAALLIVGLALQAISSAFEKMGGMTWDEIGRGMVVLAGSLAILAAAMYLMSAALPGAAALVVAAAALTLLVPVLLVLGAMSWDQIGTGLGALAATLGILAAAGMLLIPALPGLLGLGAAIALLGVGAALAGVGVLAFSTGLLALSAAGSAAIAMIGPAVQALADQIPLIAKKIGEGVIEFANVITQGAPAIVGALTAILLALIQAIVDIAPPLIDAAVLLIMKLVNAIVVLVPFLVDAGMKLIIGLLDGVSRNIGKVIQKGTDLIVNFMDGIGKAVPRLLQAGADLIVDFLEGLATTIRKNTARIQRAGREVADAIIDGMTGGISNGITTVINSVKRMAEGALNAAKKALGIASPSKEFTKVGGFTAEGFANGITRLSKLSDQASRDMGESALEQLERTMRKASDQLPKALGTAPVIRPVLDLSEVRRDASLIDGLMANKSLSIEASANSASTIDTKYATDGSEAALRASNYAAGKQYVFNQYNTSPKALSAAEIYRNTKNQLSVAKGVDDTK